MSVDEELTREGYHYSDFAAEIMCNIRELCYQIDGAIEEITNLESIALQRLESH